jgi:hypothetical protein
MIMDNTVLVLGAGASMPYGFPSGRELFFIIKKGLNIFTQGKRIVWEKLRTLGIKDKEIIDFRSALNYADSPSVDAFLEHRSEFSEVGKLSIALILIPYEDERRLFNIDGSADMPSSWYRYLMDKLNAKDCDEFKYNKLSVITFNYDRSWEHYLFTALKNRYGITDDECTESLSFIPIIHVHGSLGSLPWQASNYSRPYEKTNDLSEIQKASKQIIVMSEKEEYASVFHTVFKLMEKASKIYFLGFGYHNTNLRRLGILNLSNKANKFGTSVGIGNAEWRSISDTWGITFKGTDVDILSLFRDYFPL